MVHALLPCVLCKEWQVFLVQRTQLHTLFEELDAEHGLAVHFSIVIGHPVFHDRLIALHAIPCDAIGNQLEPQQRQDHTPFSVGAFAITAGLLLRNETEPAKCPFNIAREGEILPQIPDEHLALHTHFESRWQVDRAAIIT
ncbi:hypothetical protein [Xanthomonas citri]|uniref:hypothetical protein n=1 Tax=Xanthomonas citri TaxID=346 RepID=UPI0005B2E504|nr:hypothetical protein [Xanthomonas citri]